MKKQTSLWLTGSLMILIGAGSGLTSQTWANEGSALVPAAKAALSGREGQALVARALSNPEVARAMESLLGLQATDFNHLVQDPAFARAALLLKLEGTQNPAIHAEAARLLGIQSTAHAPSQSATAQPASKKPDVVDVSKVISSKTGQREELGLSEQEYEAWLKKPEVLPFYSVGEPFGEFSNFTRFPVMIDGKLYQTSEHYFQSMKFAGSAKDQEDVRIGGSPKQIAAMGRDRNRPLRKDWEAVKDDVMRKAVEAKFTQHPALAQLLLSTGDRHLVEHTENDRYWGDGKTGVGPNMLGKVLMETRAKLRTGELPAHAPTVESRPGKNRPSRGFGHDPVAALRSQNPTIGPYDPIFKLATDLDLQPSHIDPSQGFLRYLSPADALKVISQVGKDPSSQEITPYSRPAVTRLAKHAGVADSTLNNIPVLLPEFQAPLSDDPRAFLKWMAKRLEVLIYPEGSAENLERVLFECAVVSATHSLSEGDLKEVEKMVRSTAKSVARAGQWEMRDDDPTEQGDSYVSHFASNQLWGRDGLRFSR